MFCPNCGKEIAENSTSCPSCGATFRQDPPQDSGSAPAKKGSTWWIWVVSLAFVVIVWLLLYNFPNATITIFYILCGLAAVGLLILLISWLKTKL